MACFAALRFFFPHVALNRVWQDAVAQYQHDEGKAIDKRSFTRAYHSAYKTVVKLSTMGNTFRASGIYRMDWHAMNPKKLEPSKVYSSEPSSNNSDAPCPIKHGVGASKLALKALKKNCMDEATTCLFNEV